MHRPSGPGSGLPKVCEAIGRGWASPRGGPAGLRPDPVHQRHSATSTSQGCRFKSGRPAGREIPHGAAVSGLPGPLGGEGRQVPGPNPIIGDTRPTSTPSPSALERERLPGRQIHAAGDRPRSVGMSLPVDYDRGAGREIHAAGDRPRSVGRRVPVQVRAAGRPRDSPPRGSVRCPDAQVRSGAGGRWQELDGDAHRHQSRD